MKFRRIKRKFSIIYNIKINISTRNRKNSLSHLTYFILHGFFLLQRGYRAWMSLLASPHVASNHVYICFYLICIMYCFLYFCTIYPLSFSYQSHKSWNLIIMEGKYLELVLILLVWVFSILKRGQTEKEGDLDKGSNGPPLFFFFFNINIYIGAKLSNSFL